MSPGDILLFKGEDGISKLIQWGTGSEYSHVAICVSPEMNLAIEANTRGGVRAIDIRKIKEPYDIYRVKKSYNLTDTISYLVNSLNSSYDYFGVLFLGLLKVLAKLKLPFKNIANNWQKDRDYFCSELCYEAFFHGGGLDIVPDVPQADITSPGDISKSNIVEYISPGNIDNVATSQPPSFLKNKIINMLIDNWPFKIFILITYSAFNIYFRTLSAFAVSTLLGFIITIFFYLWIRSFKKFLLMIVLFILLIGAERVICNEKNYLYTLSKMVSKYSVNLEDAEYIGPEKIGLSYMLPFLEEIKYKLKGNLLFNKKPYAIIKTMMILYEDSDYEVRPLYILFVKNIGQQSIKIDKIEWQIYSKVRSAKITGPNEWLETIKKGPIKYPLLFPGGYFYFKYGPDPVSGYKDRITLTLDMHYKNLATSEDITKTVSGIVSYDGTRDRYYNFNLKKTP